MPLALGPLAQCGGDDRHPLGAEGATRQVDDGAGLDCLALLVIAQRHDLESMAFLQAQQFQRLPRPQQPPFIDRDHGVMVESQASVTRSVDEYGERLQIPLVDPGGDHVIGLPPREGGAVDATSHLLPRSDQGLERGALAGPRRGNQQLEAAPLAKPIDGRAQHRAMRPAECQAGLGDLPV